MIASTSKRACILVFHEDIFDYVIDQFSFLRDKANDGDLVTLAGHDWKLVYFLVETVEIDTIFFLGINRNDFAFDFLLKQGYSHLILDEFFFTQNYFQQSHFWYINSHKWHNKYSKLSLFVFIHHF